jgi:DEAD/DEAH box helicase domain-containing protein
VRPPRRRGHHLHRHPQLGRPAIFFYDAHAGGVGITASLFDRVESLLETTLELIADCACESGCPSCVHSPRCSNGNRPIDKAGAVQALALLLGREPLPALPAPPELADPPAPERATTASPASLARAPRLVYFDLETQHSAEDVGGWQNAHRMRVASRRSTTARSAGTTRSTNRRSRSSSARLAAPTSWWGSTCALRLRGAARLPGRRSRSAAHVRRARRSAPTGSASGCRSATSPRRRSASPRAATGSSRSRGGAPATSARVADYCRRDVEILRALFEHALAFGHLRFRTRDGRSCGCPRAGTSRS